MRLIAALLVAPIIVSLLLLQSVLYFAGMLFTSIHDYINKTLDKVL